MYLIFLAGTALSFSLCAKAFYLPGAAPHNYAFGEKVDLFVNALTPMISGSDNAKLVCISDSVEYYSQS
jgi:transmembrane 9 superfamily member 2/4